MKFVMNDREWTIREINEIEIITMLQLVEEDKIIMANGLTDFQHQIIYLNKDLHLQVKKQTLMHELMHCYLRTFITFPQLNEIDEEMLCDISANSHDIIHKIVEDYFGILESKGE